MLGSNAALGKTIRVVLPQLAQTCGASPDPERLAQLPHFDPADPLGQLPDFRIDDPYLIYAQTGVYSRDGGHFHASFPTRESALEFIQQANREIQKHLPNLSFSWRLNPESDFPPNNPTGACLFQHPAFQVSHQMGNRPALERGAKGTFVSAEEKHLEELGRTFRDDPYDLIAILESNGTLPRPTRDPQSLSEIAQGEYLALIHADGNGIGKRFLEWNRGVGGGRDEQFFHRMRVTVRRALVEAIQETFADRPQSYQLLMLGGDDLLLACAAPLAMPFLSSYAQSLTQFPLLDEQPLTVGAGVIFAKETFPFHRLHAMAESLADSAKQRYRTDPSLGSVVDWHLTSGSWLEDPIEERRSVSVVGNTVLSAKPYPILGENGLDTLWQAVATLPRDVARSQLRALVPTLRQGHTLGLLAWKELPKNIRESLKEILFSKTAETPYLDLGGKYLTNLSDLVEVYEVQNKESGKRGEAQ